MAEIIKDGTGSGKSLQVNSEHRALVSSVSRSLRTYVSMEQGQSFSVNTGILTLSAIDTWHWVLWWNNISNTRDLHVYEIVINWNGGSTNYNRPLEARNVITTAGAPTANHTAKIPSNNNKKSSNQAELTVYGWDGAAAGMTNSAGGSGNNTFHAQGRSILGFGDGHVISGLNEAVGIQVRSPEVGDFNIGLECFFVDSLFNL
ncbi:MAG: hypothetical protein KGD64_08255 [Candidatus Heimdallarchaeota archaeon]|nr:hypothetical protein [Candidatus Heimdallarchaeota archaeon]